MKYDTLYGSQVAQPLLAGDGLGGTDYLTGGNPFLADYIQQKASREAAWQRPQGDFTRFGYTDPNAPDPATEINQTGVSGALAANQDVFGPRPQSNEGGSDGGYSPTAAESYQMGGKGLGGLPDFGNLFDAFDPSTTINDAISSLPQGLQNTAGAYMGLLSDNTNTDKGNPFSNMLGVDPQDADYLDRDYMTPGQLSADNWDMGQKTLGMLGMGVASALTPVGWAAGQYGRGVANDAYRDIYDNMSPQTAYDMGPYRGDIGFWEDILQPDIFFGSPEDQHRAAYMSAMKNADEQWDKENAVLKEQTTANNNIPFTMQDMLANNNYRQSPTTANNNKPFTLKTASEMLDMLTNDFNTYPRVEGEVLPLSAYPSMQPYGLLAPDIDEDIINKELSLLDMDTYARPSNQQQKNDASSEDRPQFDPSLTVNGKNITQFNGQSITDPSQVAAQVARQAAMAQWTPNQVRAHQLGLLTPQMFNQNQVNPFDPNRDARMKSAVDVKAARIAQEQAQARQDAATAARRAAVASQYGWDGRSYSGSGDPFGSNNRSTSTGDGGGGQSYSGPSGAGGGFDAGYT